MQVLVVLSAVLAVAMAAPAPAPGLLSAPLLPKVQVAPAQVTVVRQPHVVTETELHYRSVPVPVKAVAYTAPEVHVSTPVIHAAPAPAVAVAAPAVTYSAVAAHAPAVTYSAVAAHAPAVAYSAVAAPSLTYGTYGAVAAPISTIY